MSAGNPTLGSAKVDKILSQFSQKYTNDEFIAEKILTPVKVKEKTGKFAKYGKENLRVYTDQIYRAPGTRANTVDYSVSQGEYSCRERSIEKLVPDEFIVNTDDPYDAKRDAVATVMDVMMVNQEDALATAMADTAVLTQNTTLSGTSQWSDEVNSTPLANITTAIETVRSATAKRPNTIVMGHSVMVQLKKHPEIREQMKYTNGGQNDDGAFERFLKDYFRVSEVLIGTAIKNTADEGQTDSLGDVWGKHFWVLYRNQRPTLMSASFGHTLIDVPAKVETYREEAKVSDVVRVRKSYDQNLMDTALAYLIKDAVA